MNVYFEIGDYISSGLKLGRGAFSDVYKGYNKHTKEDVAIKVVDKKHLSAAGRKYLEKEIAIMKELDRLCHRNVLRLYNVYSDRAYIYLVLEYCAGGDLKSFAQKQPKHRLDETTARHFVRQLADGLAFLDAHKVMHRDLKPQNLLLTSATPDATLKIADFGFARNIEQSNLMLQSMLGSPLYMSPELLREEPYDKKSDLWSVGVILYELVYGHCPWPRVKTQPELKRAHTLPIEYPREPKLSRGCLDLMRSLLRADRFLRPTLQEFLRKPFLKGYASVRLRVVHTTGKARYDPVCCVDVPVEATCAELRDAIANRLGWRHDEQLLLVPLEVRDRRVVRVQELQDDTQLNGLGLLESGDDDGSGGGGGSASASVVRSDSLSVSGVDEGACTPRVGCVYVFHRGALGESADVAAASPSESQHNDPEHDPFAFLPVPLDVASADTVALEPDANDARPLGPLLDFHRRFTHNFNQEQTLKRACDFTFAQCRLCLGQLEVQAEATLVLAAHLRQRVQPMPSELDGLVSLHITQQSEFDAQIAANADEEGTVAFELQRMETTPLEEPLRDATAKRTHLIDCVPADRARAMHGELMELTQRLRNAFAAVVSTPGEADACVKSVEAAAAPVNMTPLRKRYRDAHQWLGQVRTYFEVFRKHYNTIKPDLEAHMARQTRDAERRAEGGDARADDADMGWSLISDGFQEIGDIHEEEVKTSQRYLTKLNGFMEELTFFLRTSSRQVHAPLHELYTLERRAAVLLSSRAELASHLARQAQLSGELEPYLHYVDTYRASIEEAARRRQYDAMAARMVRAARDAFDRARLTEEARRRSFLALHGQYVLKDVFVGLGPEAAPSVAVPTVSEAPSTLDERLTRLAAPSDEFEAREGFEHIEASVIVQDGATKLMRLEADNEALRARLEDMAARVTEADARLKAANARALAITDSMSEAELRRVAASNNGNGGAVARVEASANESDEVSRAVTTMREFYGWNFPEALRLFSAVDVSEARAMAGVLLRVGTASAVAKSDVATLVALGLSADKARSLLALAKTSVGVEIGPEDLSKLRETARVVLGQDERANASTSASANDEQKASSETSKRQAELEQQTAEIIDQFEKRSAQLGAELDKAKAQLAKVSAERDDERKVATANARARSIVEEELSALRAELARREKQVEALRVEMEDQRIAFDAQRRYDREQAGDASGEAQVADFVSIRRS